MLLFPYFKTVGLVDGRSHCWQQPTRSNNKQITYSDYNNNNKFINKFFEPLKKKQIINLL